LKHWYQKCRDLIASVDGEGEGDDNG